MRFFLRRWLLLLGLYVVSLAAVAVVAWYIGRQLARLAEQIKDARLREGLAKQVDAVWETASAEALAKSDREDVERAHRRSCEALSSQ